MPKSSNMGKFCQTSFFGGFFGGGLVKKKKKKSSKECPKVLKWANFARKVFFLFFLGTVWSRKKKVQKSAQFFWGGFFLAKFPHFCTFGHFLFFFCFFYQTAPKKPKKLLFLAKFAHFGTFGHFLGMNE